MTLESNPSSKTLSMTLEARLRVKAERGAPNQSSRTMSLTLEGSLKAKVVLGTLRLSLRVQFKHGTVRVRRKMSSLVVIKQVRVEPGTLRVKLVRLKECLLRLGSKERSKA